MNRFFKGSMCMLALLSLASTSTYGEIVDESVVGSVYELGNAPTGAVEKITSEKFEQYNMSSTEVLVGQFAALNGTSIRGTRSTNTSTALILIDGFEQNLDDVDILDIESIQILKDAAATASYGIRAANGIILITTKRGSDSAKPEVKLRVQKGFLYTPNSPEFVDGDTYNSIIKDVTGYAPANSTANIDWADEMLKPIVNQIKASAQVAGSTDMAKYFVSAIYENQGTIYNYDDNATSNFSGSSDLRLRSNLELQLNKNTLFKIFMSAKIGDTKAPSLGDSSLLDLFYSTPASRYEKYFNYTNNDGTQTQYYNETSVFQENPYAQFVGLGYTKTKSRLLTAQAELTHKMDYLTEGLYIKGSIGIKADMTVTDTFTAGYTSAGYLPSGEQSTFGETTLMYYDSRSRTESIWKSYSLGAGYERSFGKHEVSATLSAQMDSYNLLAVVAPYNYFNMFAGVTYGYDDRYVAQLVTSYGGDNDLMNFVALPTLSFAWNVSNEDFWRKSDVVNSLKVRASIGLTGSDEIGSATRFLYRQTYEDGTNYVTGATASSHETVRETAYAYDGTYEKSLSTNIGIDARLFNAVNLSLDYFNETRYDIYQSYATQVSETWGGIIPYFNYGEVKSQGVELVANYSKALSKDLTLSSSFIAGYSRNIIKKSYEYSNPTYSTIGNSTSQVYGLTAEGIYQESDFTNGVLNSGLATSSYGSVQAGDIKYKDISGPDGKSDGVIDDYDITGLKSDSNPINLGLNLDLRYKRFNFGIMFDSQLNSTANVIDNIIYSPLDNGYDNVSTFAYENAWSTSNTSGTLPRLSTEESGNNARNSSLYVVSTNYLRLRSLMVGYTFPVGNAGQAFGVNLCAHNLFTIDSLPGNMNATNTSYAINGSSFSISVDFNF